MKNIILTYCFLLTALSVRADDIPFQTGEELKYDIYYKYGPVMLKAGTANYRIQTGNFQDETTYNSVLDFKTTSFFDNVYKVRDTLYSDVDNELTPLYHLRKINEGNTHFEEHLFIHESTPDYSEVRVRRENKVAVKFDTILTSESLGYDMLNIFMFARSLDYSTLEQGQTFELSVFVGRDELKIAVHFEGQSVIEKSATTKYKAYKLAIDIVDEVFNTSKSAMEIWISDDKNHVPLKLKAKLKIGAAEAYLVSHKNLKYPFTSEIIIPVRK